jgi:hypothetical protein
MHRRVLLLGVLLIGVAGPAGALDHKNLDEGRPTRLDDAYAIATGEIEIAAGLGVGVSRRGPARGLFPIEIVYGALPNLQIGVGTGLTTDPRGLDEPPKSGDLHLGALYNLNQETLAIPAFGVRLDAGLPTGVDADNATVKLRGIVTKSVDRLSFHLNAAYEFITGARGDERDGRYELAAGASYPLGAPRYTRATLVADVFAEQAFHRGDDTVVGIEAGFRYQATSRLIWDLGMGTEFAGPRDRQRFFFTTGVSFGF